MGLSNAQRQRRYIENLKAQAKGGGTAAAEIAALKDEIARLKAQARAAPRRDGGAVAGGHALASRGDARQQRSQEEIARLKAMLQEDADATALRRKVVELQAQLADARRRMKKIAKERDELQSRAKTAKVRGEASRLLTRKNYNLVVMALHPDR